MERDATPAPPFRDPKPSVERISRLAQRVLTGDILLPKFQRDFVWPREKVIGLLDSIAQNYPIGSILLWQSRQELAMERTIAGLEIGTARPDYPVNYLLDGQQRLSTVCGALYWSPSDDPHSMWNLAYDLRTKEFIHLHTLDDPPLSQIPLRYLANSATFFKRLAALDDDELRGEGDRLWDRFSDYMIAAVTLGDMPLEAIAPIFERINSTATPLTIVDLMRAATWDPSFDLRDSMDEILAALSERDFGSIDRKTLLRAVSAAAGFGFAVDDMDRLRTKDRDELKAIIADVEKGARSAVDFLATHIRVPRPAALPYANQFAVLTELFRRATTPTPAQFEAIERWFWRTTLSGYFGGWNTGEMSRDYASLVAFVDGANDIKVNAALPRDDLWRVTQFRSNSAVSKMLALILSYEDPQDILTGQRIDARKSLAWGNDKEFHHFFPRDYLKGAGRTPSEANSAANIVLLTSASNIRISNRAPSDYLAQVEKEIGRDALIQRLSTLLVTPEALVAAQADDYELFLSHRSRALHDRALGLAGEEPETATASPSTVEGEAFVSDAIAIDEA